jgi:hypothetical protein
VKNWFQSFLFKWVNLHRYRLVRLHRCGVWAGKLFCCVAAVDYMYWRWVEWWRPAASVEPAPDFVPHDGGEFFCEGEDEECEE